MEPNELAVMKWARSVVKDPELFPQEALNAARAVLQLSADNAELRRVLAGYVELGDDLQEYAGQQPECDLLWMERQQAARALLAGEVQE